MFKTEISRHVKFTDNGPATDVFYDAGALKAQVVCLKAGEEIPPCKMENDVFFYICEGLGTIIEDEAVEKISPGAAAVIPKEAGTRSIKAETDMVILAVQGKQ